MTNLDLTLHAALQNLKGHKISSVRFVEDYIQVYFGNACLTAYTLPKISLAGVRMEERTFGYKEALRRFEGNELQNAGVELGEEVVMRFSEGSLSISLRDEDYHGPEALQLKNAEGRVWVT